VTGHIKTRQIALALRVSRKRALERARAEGWPCVKQPGGLRFLENRLPADVRLALQGEAARAAAAPELAGALSQVSDKALETAKNRSALLYDYSRSGLSPADFAEAYNAGQASAHLLAELGPVSPRTLYRWLRESKEAGSVGPQTLAALAPRYGLKKSGAGAGLLPLERRLLRTFWLHNTQPTVAHAWRNLLLALPQSRCSYQTAARFLKSLPPAERDFYRLGKKRFEDLYLPYVEQNIRRYQSLDLVVSDHHVLDCVVLYQGKLIRPWVTTFQDYRSGKIVGWLPTAKPSSLSIIAAYYLCCVRYGVPRAVLFDNGRDYRSKLVNGYKTTAKQFLPEGVTEEVQVFFEGVLPALGSEVHFTRTYSGKSKGRQERYYRLLGEYLAKDIGSYVGSDATSKPDDADLMWRSINGLAKREDIPSWDYFARACGAMIEHINDAFASQGKGMGGKTRSQVFEETLPETVRRVSKEDLQRALYRSEVHKCGPNGIKHHKTWYGHPALGQYAGQDVIIRNKLVDDTEMPVYALDGTFICNALADYYAEGEDTQAAIKRVAQAKKRSFAALAERGTSEVSLAAERRIMIETALRAYDGALPSLEDLFGDGEAQPLAAGAEELAPAEPARPAKYLSALDARPEQILHMEGAHES
jgi:hypothetical protein